MLVISFKKAKAKAIDFGVPVISIGNIIVGGSGKTPVTIELAKKYDAVAVILRGYGRASKGLYVISQEGEILQDVNTSGDEAMLYAKALPNATVIVSEDRKKAILEAKELGCKIVFLDDGYSKYDIQKYDILLRPKKEPTNIFCLPSGGYREAKMAYSFANMVLKEGEDFKRVINFKKEGEILNELPQKIVILTAISKANRLLDFVPKDCKLLSFPDHYIFTKEDIDDILKTYKDYTILTTGKDLVKLSSFDIPNLVLMDLEIKFNEKLDFVKLNEYIKNYSL